MDKITEMLPFIIPLAITEFALLGYTLYHILTHKNYKRGNRTLWLVVTIIGMEYLHFCGEISRMDKADLVTRSKELLELVDLGQEQRRIKGFSRGMKQRLGIAQALLNRPKLLICDEPTSVLDPAGRKEILDILLAAKEQTTALFSTHILSDVERICTEAAFLNDGKIIMQGTIGELRGMRTSDGFVIETEQKEDADRLKKAFGDLKAAEQNTLVFHGGKDCFFAIMQYVAKNRIAIQRMERTEPTLESLFLEVTKGGRCLHCLA